MRRHHRRRRGAQYREDRPGSTVAVFGCGGVGISAIQGAKIGGARRIIAVDQFENKLAMAKRFGATDTIDASHTDALKEIRTMTGGGVDYAFEAVGLKKLAEQCFDATKTGGTAVIIGMIPVGQKVEIDGAAAAHRAHLERFDDG